MAEVVPNLGKGPVRICLLLHQRLSQLIDQGEFPIGLHQSNLDCTPLKALSLFLYFFFLYRQKAYLYGFILSRDNYKLCAILILYAM